MQETMAIKAAAKNKAASDVESDSDTDSGDVELTPMPDDEIVEENLDEKEFKDIQEKEEAESTILLEDQALSDSDDLPTPEEADNNRDFTENY